MVGLEKSITMKHIITIIIVGVVISVTVWYITEKIKGSSEKDCNCAD